MEELIKNLEYKIEQQHKSTIVYLFLITTIIAVIMQGYIVAIFTAITSIVYGLSWIISYTDRKRDVR